MSAFDVGFLREKKKFIFSKVAVFQRLFCLCMSQKALSGFS